MDYILPFQKISMADIAKVGGKNASLGEMIQHLTHAGVKVPDGFATTADAYRAFLAENNLAETIYPLLKSIRYSRCRHSRKNQRKNP